VIPPPAGVGTPGFVGPGSGVGPFGPPAVDVADPHPASTILARI